MKEGEEREFNSKIRDVYFKGLAEQIEIEYKEFKELYPKGDIPEWILFIDKKYGTPDKNV